MIIRLIILSALGVLFLYGISSRKRAPFVGASIICATLVGVTLVMFPNLLQITAEFVGVGRGVDLMFYLFILVMLLMLVNIHLRLRGHAELTTKLAREIAIGNAREQK